jgi:colanic acid/amylovoran biosynthesis glycosyltransferase
MKIAILVRRFPVVSEQFVLDQMIGLLDRGHEVDIYCAERGSPPEMRSDVLRHKLMDRTRVLFRGFPEAISFVKRLGLPTPFLKQKSYDIIHGQFGPDGVRGLLLRDLGFFSGKLIVSFRGYDVSKYPAGPNRRVYDRLFERGDLFLAVCRHIKDRLIGLGCNEEKVLVHRTGVDCSKLRFAARRLDHTGEIRLVTIARLVEKKGLEYAIRAVGKLVSRWSDIRYTIIGDGVLREDLQQLIRQLGLTGTVKLLGWKNHHEAIEILNRSHILLSPSVTAKTGDQDGIPNALKEAMALGLPVIGTMHAGIPELITDGVSGLLVPERDVEALADRVAYLIDHPDVWPDLTMAARAVVEKHYDLTKLNDQLVEMYRQLLRQ